MQYIPQSSDTAVQYKKATSSPIISHLSAAASTLPWILHSALPLCSRVSSSLGSPLLVAVSADSLLLLHFDALVISVRRRDMQPQEIYLTTLLL